MAGAFRRAVLSLCNSSLLSGTRDLWEENRINSHMPLNKIQKAKLGLFLVLRDWSTGDFPPVFDRESAWENERNYTHAMSGLTGEQVIGLNNIKPFHFDSNEFEEHTQNVSRIRAILRRLQIRPPASIVELGCGHGWLSKMLAMTGFHVIGTSIAEIEIQRHSRKVSAFECRSIPGHLSFMVLPMELVDKEIKSCDCIIVYQALHHAFDWKKTVHAACRALKPGGWLLICDEPNIAHTVVSYRVGILTNTHEVGLSRSALKKELRSAGFGSVRCFSSPLHFYVGWHWVAARKNY
ncbi:MAG: class I SAM-dependent methyltransferase [Candidatus Angelobacter sp.]